MRIPFVKMQGAANDFVVLDHRRRFLPADPTTLFARLCDRRRGIGADGVLLLELDSDVDYQMRYFNADGGAAEYCGNGARCLARLAFELGLGRGGEVTFRCAVGLQRARLLPAKAAIAVELGRVPRSAGPVELEAAGRRFRGRQFVAGVPHFVVPLPTLDGAPVHEWGRALRNHPAFAPGGTNVDFVRALEPGKVAMRTYERGVEGETLACGSGAVATALAAASEGVPSPVRVVTQGGDVLIVEYRDSENGWDVTLSGPAETVFRGEWIEPALEGAVVED